MSKQWDIAREVKAILLAQATKPEGFALAIAPEIRGRIATDIPSMGTRYCFVHPAGFNSERANRGGDRNKSHFIDIVLMEAIPGDPMSPEGSEWLEARSMLVEQIEELNYSDVTTASWEDAATVNLLYESTTEDQDEIFFQVVRLEFSE